MSWKRIILFVLAFIVVFVTVGCQSEISTGSEPSEGQQENTMNQDEAAERVEEYIDDAAAALPGDVELEPEGDTTFASCDDPTDDGPKGRVIASHVYRLSGLPTEANEANAELLHQYWTGKGYEIILDRRPERIYISAESSGDAFTIFLRSSVQGTLSLGASSPCVWPDGEP